MKGHISTLITAVVCLALGVAIGYTRSGGNDKPAPDSEKSAGHHRMIADRGETAAVAALRRRVAELEKKLAEAQNQENGENAEEISEQGHRHGGFPNLEKLKETDPERYTQITNRMAQWRQRRLERAQAKLDFLASIDTSRMGQSARTTHESYQNLLARREELENSLHAEGLTDEERDALFKEMWGTDKAIRQLGRSERDVLVRETAKMLGLKGKEVQAVTQTMRDIVDVTDSSMGGPHGPPPGGGRGGNGGGGGRGPQ